MISGFNLMYFDKKSKFVIPKFFNESVVDYLSILNRLVGSVFLSVSFPLLSSSPDIDEDELSESSSSFDLALRMFFADLNLTFLSLDKD